MLHEPPKHIARRLAEYEGMRDGAPMLRIAWDRLKRCFVVQRQAPDYRHGRGYVDVLVVGPKYRAGGPTDLGSGDAILKELRIRDDYHVYGADRKAFDRMWEEQFEQPERQRLRDDETDDKVFKQELVHDAEDALTHRVHVPPTQGHVKSFAG